jgi:hypothetical protein
LRSAGKPDFGDKVWLMDVETIKQLWDVNRGEYVGRTLYHRLQPCQRPPWAAAILELACSLISEVPPEVLELRSIADDPARWPEAYDQFHALRALTLVAVELPEKLRLGTSFLRLAENAAMVVYNGSGQPMPFDYACGSRLVKFLQEMANEARLPEFDDSATALLQSWHTRLISPAEPNAAE